jgi:hypothetical protein
MKKLCHYAECCVLFIVMPNGIMLSVVMLSVVMLSVVILNGIMLSVVVPFQPSLTFLNTAEVCDCTTA